jgi:hypothetical protein
MYNICDYLKYVRYNLSFMLTMFFGVSIENVQNYYYYFFFSLSIIRFYKNTKQHNVSESVSFLSYLEGVEDTHPVRSCKRSFLSRYFVINAVTAKL